MDEITYVFKYLKDKIGQYSTLNLRYLFITCDYTKIISVFHVQMV